MQAVIYRKETGEICGVVNSVQQIHGNSVIGPNESFGGLDLTVCGVIVVDDGMVTVSEEGFSPTHIDQTWKDKSALIVPPLEQRIADLEMAIASIIGGGQ